MLRLVNINISGASPALHPWPSHLSPCGPHPWVRAQPLHSSPGPRPGPHCRLHWGRRDGKGRGWVCQLSVENPSVAAVLRTTTQEALRGQGPLARPTPLHPAPCSRQTQLLSAPCVCLCLSVSCNNSFTEIQFTYYTVYPIRMYNSVVFCVFTEHIHNQFWNIF